MTHADRLASPRVGRVNTLLTSILPIWRRSAESGGALPSVEALALELGSSRVAVREALIRMEANGLVRRLQGSGTFPNPAALEMPVRLDQHMDYTDRLNAVGFESRVEVVEAAILELGDVPGTSRIELPATTRVMRTVKRWWADEVVAVVAVDVFPLDRRAVDNDALADVTQPVLELVTLHGVASADWMCTWPAAVELDRETAEILQYEPGRAVLRTEHLGVARSGGSVFHAIEHHRPQLVEHGMIRTIYS